MTSKRNQAAHQAALEIIERKDGERPTPEEIAAEAALIKAENLYRKRFEPGGHPHNLTPGRIRECKTHLLPSGIGKEKSQ